MSDKNNNNGKQDNNSNSYIGFGVGFGLLGGAVLSTIVGMFFKSPLIWAFGPGFGMMIGIIAGSVIDSYKNKE